MASPFDQPGHELRQLRIDRWFAAADRHDGRLRDLNGLEACFDRQTVRELAGVTLERAADAGEVARIQRLEHEHERVAAVALQPVSDLMADRVGRDVKRKSHGAVAWRY